MLMVSVPEAQSRKLNEYRAAFEQHLDTLVRSIFAGAGYTNKRRRWACVWNFADTPLPGQDEEIADEARTWWADNAGLHVQVTMKV